MILVSICSRRVLLFFSPKQPLPLGVLKTVLTSEIKFYGFFSRALFCFHGRNSHIYFHACNFSDIFTQTLRFSRALFKIFSRRLQHFHGQRPKNFHADKKIFSREKKKTLANTRVHRNTRCEKSFLPYFCFMKRPYLHHF